MNNALRRIIKLRNDGPWGSSGGSSGGSFGGNNDGGKPKSTSNQGDWIKKLQDLFKNNSFKNNLDKNSPPFKNKSLIGLVSLGLLVIWLTSGLYKVDSDENAVILYFGKFYSIATPGLNYHIPAPFGKVIKKSVTKVNTEDFSSNEGSRNSKFSLRNNDKNDAFPEASPSLMLTGDENIVDIDYQVQWQISDIKAFVFNIAEPELAIQKAAESAMREVIARTPIAYALSDGKRKIEQETKNLLQEILDSYGAGVRVVLVQMRRVDPPKQVIDAFRDVQTAKADKEKEINQAQAYSNDVIPRARGAASQLLNQAQAYEQEVVADSQGQASRFIAVHKQYSQAKNVTRRRMYLETMEKLYRNTDKILIDKNIGKSGMVPYLPINEINKKVNSNEKNS
jgi:membrane protease subunit HflK